MSDTRTKALHRIFEGDFFHGEVNEGDSGTFTCLALRVSTDAIDARDIFRRLGVTFDRTTGEAIIRWPAPWKGTGKYRITCTAELPAEIRNTLVDYDRRQFVGGRELTAAELRHTPAEQRAVLFVQDHAIANPLPD
jgi:hypothetical protein